MNYFIWFHKLLYFSYKTTTLLAHLGIKLYSRPTMCSLVLKSNTVHTWICDVIKLTDNSTKLNIKTSYCRAFPPQLNTYGLRMMFGSYSNDLELASSTLNLNQYELRKYPKVNMKVVDWYSSSVPLIFFSVWESEKTERYPLKEMFKVIYSPAIQKEK